MMGVMVTDRLEAIDAEACVEILRQHYIGRISVVVDGQPLIFPVNYAMDGQRVVFRSDACTKLFGANGKRVAFEIDSADAVSHEGWSILVVGIAREETDRQRRRLLEQLPLRPWASGPKTHWMYIAPGAITGRRLVHLSDASPL